MICLICRQAELTDGLISVPFERGEIKISITHIPAQVCPSCGDAVVADHIAVKLLRAAGEMSDAGSLEGARNFQSF